MILYKSNFVGSGTWPVKGSTERPLIDKLVTAWSNLNASFFKWNSAVARTVSEGLATSGTPSVSTQAFTGDHPASVAYDGTNIWVTQPTKLNRLNSTTLAIVNTYTLGTSLLGITYAYGSLWICDNGSNVVYRVNPADGSTIATITTSTYASAHPARALSAFGSIWITNNDSTHETSIVKINPASNGTTYYNYYTIPPFIPTSPYTMATDGVSLWLTDNGSNVVIKLDPATMDIIGNLSYGGYGSVGGLHGSLPQYSVPSGITFAGGFIWVCDYALGNIYQIDPATCQVLKTIATGANSLSACYTDGHYVYVSNYGYPNHASAYYIWILDPATGDIAGQVVLGDNPADMVKVGDVLYAGIYDSIAKVTLSSPQPMYADPSTAHLRLKASIDIPVSGDWSYTFGVRQAYTAATTGTGATPASLAGVKVVISETDIQILNTAGTVLASVLTDLESGACNVVVNANGAVVFAQVGDQTVVSYQTPISGTGYGTYVKLDADFSTQTVPATFKDVVIDSIYPKLTKRDDAMTLAEIRTQVKDQVVELSISNATIDSWINKALSGINRAEKWHERKMSCEIPIVDGVSEYELPASVGDIMVVQMGSTPFRNEGDFYQLLILDNLRDWSGNSAPAQNSNVMFNGQVMQFGTSPFQSGVASILNIQYYCGLTHVDVNGMVQPGPMVADTDWPNLHPSLHDCVVDAAAIDLIENTRENDPVPTKKIQRYQQAYKAAKAQALNNDMYPSQLRIPRG